MTAFLTPYDRSGTASKVGTKTFRKRILPVGSIDYEGQTVTFDKPFLQTLVHSFRGSAFDQVPFQLATADNKHNNDPERTRGEVTGLDLQDDGLYATVITTDEGARIISDNPRLGVSARIVNSLQRADGKSFKAAMQHVLGTLDPKINGLGPWQSIEASRQSGEKVIDLTHLEFTEGDVAPQLSDDELAQLRDIIAQGGTPQPPAPAPADGATEGDEGDGDEGELSDEELAELIQYAEAYESGETDFDSDEELIAASNDPAVQNALLLVRAQSDQQAIELARVTEQLDTQRWQSERAMFTRDYGIPPAVLDLAEPLLKGENNVIELANGAVTDAGAVMRRVLTEIGQNVKLLDLSAELGSAYEVEGQQAEVAERSNFVAQYRRDTGI